MAPRGGPQGGWEEIGLDDLSVAVHATSLALVELSALASLFNRLLKPKRAVLADRFAGSVPLFRCSVSGAEPECAAWRITGLPGFVLFRQGRPARRWLGEVHASLLIRGIEAALEDTASVRGVAQ